VTGGVSFLILCICNRRLYRRFTKYTDKYMNSPLCYDCEDSTDSNCCSTANALEKLYEETLKSMKYDYVFENDYTDRQKK